MAEDTLAHLFSWRRVEGIAARPAQLVRWQGEKYAGVLEDLYRRPVSTVSPATPPAGAP